MARASATIRGARDWDQLGELEPYFSVLTEDRYLKENLTSEALDAFYASGEEDVARLSALASGVTGKPFAPKSALEFGCGVGRLTFAMARRADRVAGIDAAASLLEIAQEQRAARGLENVEFHSVEDLAGLERGAFDFIFSYIVFQHIPTAQGERYLKSLLRLAAPQATVALHFTLARPGGAARRWFRSLRASSRLVHRFASLVKGERALPYMQMNTYDRRRIEAILAGEGFDRTHVEATDHGGVSGGVFVSTRSSPA